MTKLIKTALFPAMVLLLAACGLFDTSGPERLIHTVNGPVDAAELQMTLSHEHLMSNFGLPMDDAHVYDEAALYRQVIPYVEYVASLDIQTIFDYTTDYFGKRPDILKAIADSTGVRIVTNTGIYGAANSRYVPEYAYQKTVMQLAQQWIEEFENGIGETGIRPGFIKLAFDDGTPSDIDQKLFEAGIITHLHTGLTIAVHTGNNPGAVELQLEMLESYNVHPDAWIWTHANHHDDVTYLLNVASAGGWISLDGVAEDNVDQYLNLLEAFKNEGLLHKVLLSHDGDAYPMGGEIRPFDAISNHLIPAMRENGFTTDEIDQLMHTNPGNAYAARVRR